MPNSDAGKVTVVERVCCVAVIDYQGYDKQARSPELRETEISLAKKNNSELFLGYMV